MTPVARRGHKSVAGLLTTPNGHGLNKILDLSGFLSDLSAFLFHSFAAVVTVCAARVRLPGGMEFLSLPR